MIGVKVMGKRYTLCKLRDLTCRLTCAFVNQFDKVTILSACDRLLKPERKPRRGQLASSLASVFGTALCLAAILVPVEQIDKAQALTTKKSIKTVTPQQYAKALLNDDKQYACILTLYTKESNWNYKARNGSHHGIPQLRNEIMLSKNPLQQVSLGVKYIGHRYGYINGVPNACKALKHLNTKGWH
jgi:hypothetical protein